MCTVISMLSADYALKLLQNNLHARRKAAEIVRGDDVMHKK